MAESETKDDRFEEKFRSFRVDTTLILVGLFLALGVQNIIQFVETSSPHLSPYFFLGVGVGSLFTVLIFLNFAARIAGLVEIGKRRRYQSHNASPPVKTDNQESGNVAVTDKGQ